MATILEVVSSLNPCCNGITERLLFLTYYGEENFVLILVVMELLRDRCLNLTKSVKFVLILVVMELLRDGSIAPFLP